ncbi:hypothetical protein K443DRAFT_538018 [Laccaria amethystina LaAM-08-1]|uniref:Uncharacterized protein n=1 Tax=Laccaria amethystina LaAM-08-1 TaxID=1095629 RepID=A0A0C9XKU6_9AGAR|nr:hypothetical protein K443DRAFT_538018 [Laccaria amethystina LaAM-08-1]
MIGDVKVEAYHPETSHETFGEGIEHAASLIGEIAGDSISYILSGLGLNEGSVTYKSGYVRGKRNMLPLSGHVTTLTLPTPSPMLRGTKTRSFPLVLPSSSHIAPSKPSFDLNAAISAAEFLFRGEYNLHPALVEYLASLDGLAARLFADDFVSMLRTPRAPKTSPMPTATTLLPMILANQHHRPKLS